MVYIYTLTLFQNTFHYLHILVSVILCSEKWQKILTTLYCISIYCDHYFYPPSFGDHYPDKTNHHTHNCHLSIKWFCCSKSSAGVSYNKLHFWDSTIRGCWDRKQAASSHSASIFVMCILSYLSLLSHHKDMTSHISKDNTWTKMRLNT
jgi:hypothetical protein